MAALGRHAHAVPHRLLVERWPAYQEADLASELGLMTSRGAVASTDTWGAVAGQGEASGAAGPDHSADSG